MKNLQTPEIELFEVAFYFLLISKIGSMGITELASAIGNATFYSARVRIRVRV